MQAVSSVMHLVAQREALQLLEQDDSGYTLILSGWQAMLTAAEKEALQAYDALVDEYRLFAPKPDARKGKLH